MPKLTPEQLRAIDGPPPSKLDIALQHVANGWSVFPLVPNGKEPLTPHGFKDSTRDSAQIRKWWGRWPDANIGGDCGASGVTVADLDVKNGGRGPDNWEAVTRDVPHDPGFTCVTPTGGLHVIWRDSEGVASSNGQVAPNVDIKSRGGYIVLPGSEIDGKSYRTRTGEPLGRIENLPSISEELRTVSRSRSAVEQKVTKGTTSPRNSRTRQTLAELLDSPPARGQGTTNNWLTQVCGHLARMHRDDHDAYIAAARSAVELVDPHYEDFGKTTSSVWQKEQAKPSPEDQRAVAVAEAVERLWVGHEAKQQFRQELAQDDAHPGRLISGDAFMLDIPDGIPAIWGLNGQVLWAEGEALMLVGPPGVGKTTLANQLVRARLGLSTEVLDLPVKQTVSRVVYLAMDRPRQIARSLRRSFNEPERKILKECLRVWQGPPPADIAAHPETLLKLARLAGADTIIVDSLKDAAIGLSDDETGAGYNRARQTALADGVELLEIHHMVKNGPNGGKPTRLADVYGSAWITAGAGSVVLLWGEAGDENVELSHLKQPAETVGPWQIHHDHRLGQTRVLGGTGALELLAAAGNAGLTVSQLVQRRGQDPQDNRAKQKARRDLRKLVTDEKATEDEAQVAGQKSSIFRLTNEAREVLF